MLISDLHLNLASNLRRQCDHQAKSTTQAEDNLWEILRTSRLRSTSQRSTDSSRLPRPRSRPGSKHNSDDSAFLIHSTTLHYPIQTQHQTLAIQPHVTDAVNIFEQEALRCYHNRSVQYESLSLLLMGTRLWDFSAEHLSRRRLSSRLGGGFLRRSTLPQIGLSFDFRGIQERAKYIQIFRNDPKNIKNIQERLLKVSAITARHWAVPTSG